MFHLQYFHPIVEKLLETTDRADAATANLRSAAYEALMEMVKNSPKVRHVDCLQQFCDELSLDLRQSILAGLLRDGAEDCDDHPGAAAVRPADGVADPVPVGQDAVQRSPVVALCHASG